MTLDKEKVRDWANETGGYGIVDPQLFLDMGMDPETVKRLTHSFSDDPDLGKGAVHRNDGTSGPTEGVAEFDAVDAICRELGAKPCHTWMGRGKNFRGTIAAILETLNASA